MIDTGKPIRLPAYLVSLLSKWQAATTILTESLGRRPRMTIGKALRLSKKRMGIVAKAIRVNNLTPRFDNLDEDGPARSRVNRRSQQRPWIGI